MPAADRKINTNEMSLYKYDTQYDVQSKEAREEVPKPSPSRSHQSLVLSMTLVAIGYMLWSAVFAHKSSQAWHVGLGLPRHAISSPEDKRLVLLEAHIMSKCPDAKDCLKMMVLPTMQQVLDKVNFTLSYIGTPMKDDGVDCKHGPEECMGNIIELCAAKIYPDPKIYLGFTMCLTNNYQEIPELDLVQDCALEHGIELQKIHDCAIEDNGGMGMSMLRKSVRHSAEVGVTTSCTVRLNDEIYCVRDENQWKDCPHGSDVKDLVLAIDKLYQSA